MFGTIQKYLLAGAALLVAGLVFALKLVSAQKAAAKAEVRLEKVNRKTVEAVRGKERRAQAAAAKARQEAEDLERKIEQDRQKGRRDEFMDPRLKERQRSGGNGGGS